MNDYIIVNTYCPSLPAQPGINGVLLAVLVLDGTKKFRVYIGLVAGDAATQEDARGWAAQWVARHGAKQDHAKAKAYFPFIEESDYGH